MPVKLLFLSDVKFYTGCLFLCFCAFVPAQEKALTPEQLEKRFNGCYSLMAENPDEAFLCLNKLKPLMEQAGHYKGIVNYYDKTSEFYLLKGEYQKATKLVAEGYKKYQNNLSEDDKVFFRLLELRILEPQNKYREILLLIQEIMPEVKKDFQKAFLYITRASSLQEIGEYEKAASDYYKALRIYKSLKETENIITVYNRLGLLYQNIKETQKALTCYKQALEYARQINSERSLQVVYCNLGSSYKELDSIEKSLEYYKKSAELAKKYDNRIDVARILLNMGDAYIYAGDFTKAFENLKESLAISKKDNIPVGIMYNYISLGKAYGKTHQYELSETSYNSALVYAKSLNMPDEEANIYYGLYEVHGKTKNFEKSLFFYIKSDSIKNGLLSEEKQKAIAEIEIKYQTELKDQEIERANLEISAKKLQNRTLILGIVFLAAIAGFGVFFLVYRNKTLRRLYDRNMELLHTVNFYKIAPDHTDERDHLKKIFDRLLELLNTEKIFKDPNLGIKDIAEMLKTNEKYVSSAISAYAKMNYSNFINFYRTNEAKELIDQMKFANLNEIMYACGFNSRTTFYNAFKNFTGLSPKQFKEMKKEDTVSVPSGF